MQDYLGQEHICALINFYVYLGVPESENQDIVKVVTIISKILEVSIEKHDISSAHGMPKISLSYLKVISQPSVYIAGLVNRDL